MRGYNDKDALSGNLETSSPTTTRLGRAVLLSISANKKWRGWTADVSTTFLQGLPQERRLWVKLPQEALEILGGDEQTRMYLIKQRKENNAIDDTEVPELCGLICLHVDDLLGTGNQCSEAYNHAEKSLKETFSFRTWDDGNSMEYCDARLMRKEDFTWELGHEEYLKKVRPSTIHRGRQTDNEMTSQDVS